jgi:ataxia telangiectasia mutated family protein
LHHQTIITILEVLLYDPLYDWTVSTAEANKRQKDEHDGSEMSNVSMYGGRDEGGFRGTWVFLREEFKRFFLLSTDVNVTAERALLRLKAKLQGTESGKSTTVEDQVGTLIQQAVNPSNLCKLFHGWQPYL